MYDQHYSLDFIVGNIVKTRNWPVKMLQPKLKRDEHEGWKSTPEHPWHQTLITIITRAEML